MHSHSNWGSKWTQRDFPLQKVFWSWEKIASELCGQWNVFAVDLQNEPSQASWGSGNPANDWDTAAATIGDHVHERCSRWLVFVEGVADNPGAFREDNAGTFWGENFKGASRHPVLLKDTSKLVYSPHAYGPAVYSMSYFHDRDFPRNMPAIWDDHWGSRAGAQPIVIGETGGHYTGDDRTFQDALIEYCVERGVGLFYFALNPDAHQTGGILGDDWTTRIGDKLRLLRRLPATSLSNLPPMPPPPPPTPPSPSPSPPPPAPPPPPACVMGRQPLDRNHGCRKKSRQDCVGFYRLVEGRAYFLCSWEDDACAMQKQSCASSLPPSPPGEGRSSSGGKRARDGGGFLDAPVLNADVEIKWVDDLEGGGATGAGGGGAAGLDGPGRLWGELLVGGEAWEREWEEGEKAAEAAAALEAWEREWRDCEEEGICTEAQKAAAARAAERVREEKKARKKAAADDAAAIEILSRLSGGATTNRAAVALLEAAQSEEEAAAAAEEEEAAAAAAAAAARPLQRHYELPPSPPPTPPAAVASSEAEPGEGEYTYARPSALGAAATSGADGIIQPMGQQPQLQQPQQPHKAAAGSGWDSMDVAMTGALVGLVLALVAVRGHAGASRRTGGGGADAAAADEEGEEDEEGAEEKGEDDGFVGFIEGYRGRLMRLVSRYTSVGVMAEAEDGDEDDGDDQQGEQDNVAGAGDDCGGAEEDGRGNWRGRGSRLQDGDADADNPLPHRAQMLRRAAALLESTS